MEKIGFIYIITNRYNTVLYIGVTSDIVGRIYDHKSKRFPKSFSAKYNLYKLVYFELFETITDAINREKQLKGSSRKKKNELIFKLNPEWIELDAEEVEKEISKLR